MAGQLEVPSHSGNRPKQHMFPLIFLHKCGTKNVKVIGRIFIDLGKGSDDSK